MLRKVIGSLGIVVMWLVIGIQTTDCQAQWEIKKEAAPTFKSNLPIVHIYCRNEINSVEKVPAEMIIDGQYDGAIGIKLRGNSSQSFNQKKYSIETRSDIQEPRDVSLFGMPAEHDWVLMCTYNDVSMMRDAFACQLWNEMGHWGPHFQMVEVTLNGEYIGVYGFCELIKVSKGRLDISAPKNQGVKTKTVAPESLGYLLRVDKYDESDNYFKSKHKGLNANTGGFGGMMGGFGGFGGEMPDFGGFPGFGENMPDFGGAGGGFPGMMDMSSVVWTCRYPKKSKITDQQFDYVHKFVDDFEDAMLNEPYSQSKVESMVDLNSFIDYFLHTELSLNADAYKSSAYFYKTADQSDGTKGKMCAGPVWDYNLAYGCCNFCSAGDINAWAFEGCETSPTPAFWKQFAVNPQLKQLVEKRYTELRKTTLSTKHIHSIIDNFAVQLRPVQKRHFEKYPELMDTGKKSDSKNNADNANSGFGGFGGFGGFTDMMGGFGGGGNGMLSMFRSYTVSSYEEEIQYLKNWFTDRLKVLDERFLRPL